MPSLILLVLIGIMLGFGNALDAQADSTDRLAIERVIETYFYGTAEGDPDTLRKVFHPNFNLYVIQGDTLTTRSGRAYIDGVKRGQKANRIGKLLMVDVEGNAAIAKASILIPGWRLFTDYFLLMKIGDQWKIVQKSYSSVPLHKE